MRNTENELDQRISSYSKLASQLSTGYYSAQASSALRSSTEDARAMEGEISDMLDTVSCRWMYLFMDNAAIEADKLGMYL